MATAGGDRFAVLAGQAIRLRARELGASQRSLAEGLGVSEGTVSRWLRGGAPISLQGLHMMCEALGESPVRVVRTAYVGQQDEKRAAAGLPGLTPTQIEEYVL